MEPRKSFDAKFWRWRRRLGREIFFPSSLPLLFIVYYFYQQDGNKSSATSIPTLKRCPTQGSLVLLWLQVTLIHLCLPYLGDVTERTELTGDFCSPEISEASTYRTSAHLAHQPLLDSVSLFPFKDSWKKHCAVVTRAWRSRGKLPRSKSHLCHHYLWDLGQTLNLSASSVNTVVTNLPGVIVMKELETEPDTCKRSSRPGPLCVDVMCRVITKV